MPKNIEIKSFKDFSLEELHKRFQMKSIVKPLFEHIDLIQPSDWLQKTLQKAFKQALLTEKERSEAIVYPILSDLQETNGYCFSIFSGIFLIADEEHGLKGECDFIVGGEKISKELAKPLIIIVEAKQGDITKHWGQIAAQMLGALIYNQNEGNEIRAIYGCITTGEQWHFLKIENDYIIIDDTSYFLKNELAQILGIFQMILTFNNLSQLKTSGISSVP